MDDESQPRRVDLEAPEWVREAARLVPDGTVDLVDPAWPDDLPPPPYAIAGTWQVDRAGEPVDFQANPEYEPSPQARGLPAPTDDLDAALQAGASGYGPPDAVLDELMHATVAVPTRGEGGPLLTGVDPDGASVVAVYSSPSHLRAREAGPYRVLSGRQLVTAVPSGHDVLINPDAEFAARISLADLEEHAGYPG